VEEGEIDRVPAEAGEENIGEEKIAEGMEATEGIDGIRVGEEVGAAISSRADPDFVDSSSKESIADMAITVYSHDISNRNKKPNRRLAHTGTANGEGGLQFVEEAHQETSNAKRHQND
jgi:hypothetical protein